MPFPDLKRSLMSPKLSHVPCCSSKIRWSKCRVGTRGDAVAPLCSPSRKPVPPPTKSRQQSRNDTPPREADHPNGPKSHRHLLPTQTTSTLASSTTERPAEGAATAAVPPALRTSRSSTFRTKTTTLTGCTTSSVTSSTTQTGPSSHKPLLGTRLLKT